MKFQLYSDLHLEFHHDSGASFLKDLKVLADTLVLAGDITIARPWMLDLVFKSVSSKWKDVIYLAGNHEHYNVGIKMGYASIKKALRAYPNIHFLNNGGAEIEGIKIFGGTGWYDAPKDERLKKKISDYALIKDIEEVYGSWKEFQTKCEAFKPDLVISHHLPDERCVAAPYRGDPVNCFFVSGFDVESVSPKMWIFGHSHTPTDFMIGTTRMVCNAFGYPTETKRGFNDELVLEVLK